MKRIGEILTRLKTPVEIQDTEFYKRLTIRINHQGVSVRDTEIGAKIGTKNQFRVRAGDFILSKIDARQGAFGIVPEEVHDGIITGNFWTFRVDNRLVDTEWFLLFTNSDAFLDLCKRSSTGNTHRKYLNEAIFLNHELAIPSLEEQRKAVVSCKAGSKRVDEVQHEIAHQQTLLSKLKQAILQEAIQGKLTDVWRAANPDVEPASQLLKRIQAEKARLIAEKKLRPEKLLPKISPEEIPFEIPENWKWCRLGAITTDVSYGTSQKAHLEAEGIPVLRMGNITTGGTLAYSNLKYVSPKIKDLPRLFLESGDIVFNRTNSYELVGKSAVFRNEKPFTLASYLIRVRLFESLVPEYTAYFINSEICRTEFIEPDVIQQNGQANFNGTKLKTILIPLPPLAEQAAIVERVEALMTTCRALEAEIEQCRTHAAHLLQAVLKEAFAPSSESTPSATTCPPTVPLLSP